MAEPFLWGAGGKKITPGQAAVLRQIAAQKSQVGTPSNLGEGLNAIGSALVSNAYNARAGEAETEGQQAVAAALAQAQASGDPKALYGIVADPWATEGQRMVAGTLLDKANMMESRAYDEGLFGRTTGDRTGLADQLGLEGDARNDYILTGAYDTAAGVSDAPSSVREWEYFNALPDDQKGEYIRMKRANPYLDVGTGFVQPDPINPGSTSGPAIAKDNFTPAYDAAAGTAGAKVDVENQAALDSLASKLPGLQTVIGELGGLAKTATYTQTGQLIDNIMRETGREPSEAAIARTKYVAMVDNQVLPLLRDTFGAAFTVKEGETLRATLGDPNKSPSEKQVILESFIEQKVRDLDALKSRVPNAAPNAQQQGAWTVLGVE